MMRQVAAAVAPVIVAAALLAGMLQVTASPANGPVGVLTEPPPEHSSVPVRDRIDRWTPLLTPTPVETAVRPSTSPVSQPPTPALPSLYQEERLALYEMVCATFPDNPWMCGRVVWVESIGDWAAQPADPLLWHRVVYGPYVSSTCDRGLMQINCVHVGRFAAHGWDYYVDVYDPVKTLVIAREIYDDAGCGAWTTC